MKLKNIVSVLVLLMAFGLALQSKANALGLSQQFVGGTSSGFGVIGSKGFFLTDLSLDYYFDNNLSLGYEGTFMVTDFFGWGNQVAAKYTFDINENGLTNLKPYAEMLMGFIVASDDDTEVGFLGGFGFGVDYFIRKNWALGSNMIFNFTNDIFDKHFIWNWKLLTVKYVF